MREIVLEARAVTRTYGTGTGATHALRGVDVEIEQGRFTAIIGASGCGKSTLLQALGGLDAPTSGKVLLEGQDLYALPDAALARLRRTRLGFVFQAFHLLPEYTVRDNILLPLLLDKREPDEEYLALLTRQLGLTALLQRQPTQLSGGQQQRTALARILVGRPRILMLDEPFSALDSYLREEVESEVGSLLAGFDGTALLVTHNRDEAYRLCREMAVMDGGRVLRTGTTKEVFADPQSITAARLTGCKNILPCTRVDAHTVRLTGWDAPLRLAAEVPEHCTAVGIRAHDLAPCAPGAQNALPVKAVSSSENPFDWNLIFLAPDGTTRLWWKVSKATLGAAAPAAPQCFAAAPEGIMPLV